MTDVNVTVETGGEDGEDSMVLSDMSLLPRIGGASVVRVVLLFLCLMIILLPGAFDFGLFPYVFALDVVIFVTYVFAASWTPASMGMLTHAARRAQLAWGQRVYQPVRPSEYSFDRPATDYRHHGDDSTDTESESKSEGESRNGADEPESKTETETESDTHVDRPLHV